MLIFLLQSFALLLSNLCILSVQLDLSAVGKIDKTNLPGFNSLKNAHILPSGNSYIPSWDSWIVECDMFTPPAILYYSHSQSASNIYSATVDRATWSFCPKIRPSLVGHALGNPGRQIPINDHFLLPSRDTLTHPSLKTGRCGKKRKVNLKSLRGEVSEIWEFKRDKSGSCNLHHQSPNFLAKVTQMHNFSTAPTNRQGKGKLIQGNAIHPCYWGPNTSYIWAPTLTWYIRP